MDFSCIVKFPAPRPNTHLRSPRGDQEEIYEKFMIYIYISHYIYIYMCIYMYIYICVFICIYIYMYMCVYVMFVYTYDSPVLYIETLINEPVIADLHGRFTGSAVASDCPGPRKSRCPQGGHGCHRGQMAETTWGKMGKWWIWRIMAKIRDYTGWWFGT